MPDRNTRWCCWRCHGRQSDSQSRNYRYVDLKPAKLPREVMEKEGPKCIDIYPNNPDITVDLNLPARLDSGIPNSLLHESAVHHSLGASALQRDGEQSLQHVIDASYRLTGTNYSVSESFMIVSSKPDPDFSVLLASKASNKKGTTKRKGSHIAPLFERDSRTKKQVEAEAKKVEEAQKKVEKAAKAAKEKKMKEDLKRAAKAKKLEEDADKKAAKDSNA